MGELWKIMEANYGTTVLLVWLALGGIVNGWVFYIIYKARKHYNKYIKPDLIRRGRSLIHFSKTISYYGDSNWGVFLGLGNLFAFILAVLWPAGLPISLVALLLWGIQSVHLYIKRTFFLEEHIVTRYLKNHPDMVVGILESKYHRYYDIAKRLQSAGVIEINKSDQSVKIDGKEYFLKMK